MRRPTRAAIRWMIRTRWSASRKRTLVCLQPAEALDVDLVGAVDQDVGHGRIGHQRRQRADAESFFQQIVGQPPPLLIH